MGKLVPKLRFKEFSGEWEENKVVIKIISGNNYPLSSYNEDGILLIQGLNIYPNKLNLDNPVYIADDFLTGKDIYIQKNDILIGLNRPIIDNKLKICLFDKNEKALLYQRAGILQFDKEKLSNLFLYYYLSSHMFLKQLLLELVGSDQPYIKSDLFKKTKNIFPKDKKEQQKIADTLSSLDALIEAQTKKVEALKQHKKGLMQQMFPQEGEKTPKLRFKEFSGEWEEKSLEQIGEIHGSGVDKKIVENENLVMLLNYMDVYNNNFIYSNNLKQQTSATNIKIKKCNIKKGDIFFTPSSEVPDDIAKSAVAMENITNGVYSYHLIRLRLFENIDLKFRTYVFNTDLFFKTVSKLAQGSGTRYTITLPEFRSIKILIPESYKEQQKIADTLSSLDALIEAQTKKVEALKQHKKGLMQQMFVSEEE